MLNYPEGAGSQMTETQAEGIFLSFVPHSSFLESRLGHEEAGVTGVRVLMPPDLTQFSESNTADLKNSIFSYAVLVHQDGTAGKST